MKYIKSEHNSYEASQAHQKWICERFHELREQHGMRKKDIAERLNITYPQLRHALRMEKKRVSET